MLILNTTNDMSAEQAAELAYEAEMSHNDSMDLAKREAAAEQAADDAYIDFKENEYYDLHLHDGHIRERNYTLYLQRHHNAHVIAFDNWYADAYSDMAEVHQHYLGGVYTTEEYREIESQCHPALVN